jgi:alkylation response protein AidB-like acyl-CoA dehydrogenase
MQEVLGNRIHDASIHVQGADTRYARFFREFRTADLSFLPCRPSIDSAALHATLIDGLFSIGGFGIAEGVGATMHLYMLAAFAKFPIRDPALAQRRAAFIDMVGRGRLLIANTGSDARRPSDSACPNATVAVPVNGGYRVNGAKSFLSLAQVADLVVFTADILGRGVSFFVAPLNNHAIQIGSPQFDPAFPLHTHSVLFEDLVVPEAMTLACEEKGSTTVSAFTFQRAVFQSLISAVYLGAARRALQEAARFATQQGLADSDGARAHLGRSAIRIQGALAATRICGDPFADFIENPCQETLQVFADTATVAKQTGCIAAAEVVTEEQRFIGTRSMQAGHVMAEISRLVQFGPLHPVVSAQAERHFGDAFLRSGS